MDKVQTINYMVRTRVVLEMQHILVWEGGICIPLLSDRKVNSIETFDNKIYLGT